MSFRDLKTAIIDAMDEVTLDEARFTSSMVNKLRQQYGRLNGINPDSPAYRRLIELLDKLSQPQLQQIASANIKFVSKLALNRLHKPNVRRNYVASRGWLKQNEETELQELVKSKGDGHDKKAKPVKCKWFAMCPNPATETRSHPVLGKVPICARCQAKMDRIEKLAQHEETQLDEVHPPGEERWLKHRKDEGYFRKKYGKRWKEVLYATAWKRKKQGHTDKTDKHEQVLDEIKWPWHDIDAAAAQTEKWRRERTERKQARLAALKPKDDSFATKLKRQLYYREYDKPGVKKKDLEMSKIEALDMMRKHQNFINNQVNEVTPILALAGLANYYGPKLAAKIAKRLKERKKVQEQDDETEYTGTVIPMSISKKGKRSWAWPRSLSEPIKYVGDVVKGKANPRDPENTRMNLALGAIAGTSAFPPYSSQAGAFAPEPAAALHFLPKVNQAHAATPSPKKKTDMTASQIRQWNKGTLA